MLSFLPATAGINVLSPFAPLFLLSDFQNFYAWKKKPLPLNGETTEDYTILVPIFNSPRFFQNKAYLDTVKERAVLCIAITDAEMREFADGLEMDGYKVFRHDGYAESPWHVLRAALGNAQHLLLRDALPFVGTRYTIFLDGDSWPLEDLGRACAVMEEQGYGLASVIVRPSSASSWIGKLQDVEYQFAMVTRRFRPWLTSGACIIGQTQVLRTVMTEHTTYFYGGDIEVGRLANRFCRICHIDLTVKTDIPQTFLRWFRQRIGWWAGSFRHSIVNFDKDLFRAPVWTLYGTGIIWGLLGLRWFDLSKHWYVIPFLMAIYLSLNVIMGLRFKIRSRWLLAYPLYALFQSLALPPFGLYRYLQYSFRNHTWGRLRV